MSTVQAPSPAHRCVRDGAIFRRIAGNMATGVSVVTTVDADRRPFGLTMSAVVALSLDPALFLICVNERSESLTAMLASSLFCINVLACGQEETSQRFA